MIRFACGTCKERLAVPDRFAGRRGRCPACGGTNVVPATSEFADPPAPRPVGPLTTPPPATGPSPFGTVPPPPVALSGRAAAARPPHDLPPGDVLVDAIELAPVLVAPGRLGTGPTSHVATRPPGRSIPLVDWIEPPPLAVPPLAAKERSVPTVAPAASQAARADRWVPPPAADVVVPDVHPFLPPTIAPPPPVRTPVKRAVEEAAPPADPPPPPPPPALLDLPPAPMVAVSDAGDAAGVPSYAKVLIGLAVLAVVAGVIWAVSWLLVWVTAQGMS